ncbi:MAG: cell division protein FtsA [Firmicutes bacterium]|nr:cell division protein FtsA [Bacillota bacterium]
MARRDIIAGLDIGTSAVRCAICEVDHRGNWNIIGLGSCRSEGIKKGAVVDIESTVGCILQAVETAQRMAGVTIDSVYVGVPNTHASLMVTRGIVAVSSEDKEITEEDVERVLQAARVINLPPNRQIIDIIPRQYIIDGYEGIRSPTGMAGIRLEVEALLVTGAITSIQNLVRCVERAGLEVESLVLNAMAMGELLLSHDEKELGAVLADLGGGTCEIAYFSNGVLQSIGAIPLGGDHITSDIAFGLRTSLGVAEKAKIEHGTLLRVPEDRTFTIPDVGGEKTRDVSVRQLSTIIEARVHEMLSFIAEELPKLDVPEAIPAGGVLAGGVAATEGLVPYLQSMLDCCVRLAQDGMGGEDTSYATAVGLVMHALKRPANSDAGRTVRRERKSGSLFARVVDWLRDMWE